MFWSGAPILVPPSPPPSLRGLQFFTVRPLSMSTTTRLPSILRPSPYLNAAEGGRIRGRDGVGDVNRDRLTPVNCWEKKVMGQGIGFDILL